MFSKRVIRRYCIVLSALLMACLPEKAAAAETSKDSEAGEKPKWIIAAEEFTTEGIPSVYTQYSTVLPRLLLDGIAGIKSRMVFADERQTRAIKDLSEKRLKLVQDRARLILDRDKILLTDDSRGTKGKKRRDLNRDIKSKQDEIKSIDETIEIKMSEERIVDNEEASIELWKDGGELYKRAPDISLAGSLLKDGVSAVITGTIKDIGGYMFVEASIDTGYGGTPPVTVSEAVPYEDLETVVSLLVSRLLPGMSNRVPVRLNVAIEPRSARLFIDGRLIPDHSVPITVFSGEHTLSSSAQGFISTERTARFEGRDTFNVRINLEEEKLVTVTFDTKRMPADIFFHTRYLGETPEEITLPSFPTIGEALSDSAKTYFLFNPEMIEGQDVPRLTIVDNKKETAKRIERQRNILYWSLGLLYISLPVSMLSYGVAENKYRAWEDGKFEDDGAIVDEINTWSRVADVSKWVSVGLGVNFAFQLVRYILAANQTVPKTAY